MTKRSLFMYALAAVVAVGFVFSEPGKLYFDTVTGSRSTGSLQETRPPLFYSKELSTSDTSLAVFLQKSVDKKLPFLPPGQVVVSDVQDYNEDGGLRVRFKATGSKAEVWYVELTFTRHQVEGAIIYLLVDGGSIRDTPFSPARSGGTASNSFLEGLEQIFFRKKCGGMV